MLELKWWYFDQNISGGYFIHDENVSDGVFIQASRPDVAQYLFNEIIESKYEYSTYCECCGERWDDYNSAEGTDTPEIYGKSIEDLEKNTRFFHEYFVLHYYDGTKKYFRVGEGYLNYDDIK